MPIRAGSALIPDTDLSVAFIRAGGPGGQNDLAGSAALSDVVKHRLRTLAGRRLTDDGSVLIIAREYRSQEQNRREAEQRLADLVSRALIEPKVRRKTKPTRAAGLRRLEGKTRRSSVKRQRGRVRDQD
jgi:ribosome-associated protein